MQQDRRALKRIVSGSWTAAYAHRSPLSTLIKPKTAGAFPVADMHRSGILLLVDEPLARGAKLVLRLKSAEGEEIAVEGEVVWASEGDGDHAYSVGIHFTKHHGGSWERLRELEAGCEDGD